MERRIIFICSILVLFLVILFQFYVINCRFNFHFIDQHRIVQSGGLEKGRCGGSFQYCFTGIFHAARIKLFLKIIHVLLKKWLLRFIVFGTTKRLVRSLLEIFHVDFILMSFSFLLVFLMGPLSSRIVDVGRGLYYPRSVTKSCSGMGGWVLTWRWNVWPFGAFYGFPVIYIWIRFGLWGIQKFLWTTWTRNHLLTWDCLRTGIEYIYILRDTFFAISFHHVYREKNTIADRLSKKGLEIGYGEMHYQLSISDGCGATGFVSFSWSNDVSSVMLVSSSFWIFLGFDDVLALVLSLI